jgi:hypothetical protein
MFSLPFLHFSLGLWFPIRFDCHVLVSRSTEHDHVKDNLPAKSLRIRTFGKMKLEDFKDLISVADYRTCETKMDKHPTWYPLTLDVFIKFLYKVIVYQFLLFILPFISYPWLILIHACDREKFPMRPILQQGSIVRLLPKIAGLPRKFGTQ